MKLFRSITVTPEHCPQDIYANIVRIKPDAQRGSIFHVEAKPGDEESARLVEKIAAFCKRHGLGKIPGAYSFLLLPGYDARDFAAAPLLQLVTQRKMFHEVKRDGQGRLCLPATEAKASVKFGSIYPKPWIVISDAVRRILLSGGLQGLAFREVCLVGESIHSAKKPFLELGSSVTLPKMRNSEPRQSDPLEEFQVNDTFGEPHYSEPELNSVGP